MKKEGWFIVDRFPGLTADALPVTDALEDTGILIIEDEEPDEPIVYDSLPRLMDVGNWKEFPHDPMQPIEWKELRILRPNTNSITITNNSPLWMLEVREQIGAGDLLFTAVIKPSDT